MTNLNSVMSIHINAPINQMALSQQSLQTALAQQISQQSVNLQVALSQASTGYITATSIPTTTNQYAITGGSVVSGNYFQNWPNQQWTNISADDCGSWNNELSLSFKDGKAVLKLNEKYVLPDGTVIFVDQLGNFRIDDTDAKVVYKANRNREFNRFVNASDLLAKFIDYVRSLKVDRSEVATLPLALFINWLVIEAAEADDDEVPSGIVAIPQHRLLLARMKPRCDYCKRFIPRRFIEKNFNFCNPAHATARFQLLSA